MTGYTMLATVLIGTACTLGTPNAEQRMTAIDPTDQRVLDKFAAFESGQDVALVQQALDLVEAAERDLPFGDRAARKRALARRLLFLSALDRQIDPHWDPKKLPPKGAAPPATHGMVYSTGEVDPESIPDPAERARYARALAASKEYERHYDVQFQLRQIDERAMRFLELLLSERYSSLEQDRREIEALLAAAPLLEARRQKLRGLLPSRGR